MSRTSTLALVTAALAFGACKSDTSSSGSSTTASGSTTASSTASSTSAGSSSSGSATSSTGSTGSGSTSSTASSSSSGSSSGSSTGGVDTPINPNKLTVPTGFVGEVVATGVAARELATLPNGDLLVSTTSSDIYLLPNAEAQGAPGTIHKFITMTDDNANGVAYAPNGFIYVATEHAVWKIPYTSGDQSEPDNSAVQLAAVRQGGIPAGSDGDVHHTSSVAVSSTTVFVGVGSSCNACVEIDPTRATIQQMGLDGSNMTTLATRFRNAIALTLNPATGTLWAGGAGQDSLPNRHPYEFMDPVTLHTAPVDYGWPDCEENQHAYTSGADCSNTIAPALEFDAYATNIGAIFYPAGQTGTYAFPLQYAGGLFVTHHGSWHTGPSTPPSVSFVPMNGDAPTTAVDWNDPTAQWTPFLYGMGTTSSSAYTARATGVAVGTQGSLFVGDDQNKAVYRIRPAP